LLKAETDNLSSSGFYCTVSEPFSPGEYLECRIVIPSQSTPLVLDRQVRIVRVEIKGLEPGFGVACEFTNREHVSFAGDGEEQLQDGANH
jgi:hypothetical protein